ELLQPRRLHRRLREDPAGGRLGTGHAQPHGDSRLQAGHGAGLGQEARTGRSDDPGGHITVVAATGWVACWQRSRQASRLSLRGYEEASMTPLAAYLLLFLAVGVGFIFVHLVAGKFIRPARPNSEKETIYECGEPTIGSAWVQFDLRFYVVALLFVIFDVEVAFFFPWAVVFGKANAVAQQTAAPAEEQRAAYEANLLS